MPLPLDKMLLHRMKENYVSEIMENNGGEVICEQHEMEEFYQTWFSYIRLVCKETWYVF